MRYRFFILLLGICLTLTGCTSGEKKKTGGDKGGGAKSDKPDRKSVV